jgi:hypothetical protein
MLEGEDQVATIRFSWYSICVTRRKNVRGGRNAAEGGGEAGTGPSAHGSSVSAVKHGSGMGNGGSRL